MASTPIGHHSSESGTVPVACEATSLLWQESKGSTAALDFSIVSFVPKILSSIDRLSEAWRPLSHSLAQRLWVLEKDKPRIPLRRNETNQSRSQKIFPLSLSWVIVPAAALSKASVGRLWPSRDGV